MQAIRLVATDLDGTLLGSDGQVSPRAVAAVAAARTAGIHVIPVTGRPPQALWDLAAAGGLGPLAVCSNGAVVLDLEHRTILEVNSLPATIARRLVDLVRAAEPRVVFAMDDLEGFYYEPGFFAVPADWQEAMAEIPDVGAVVTDKCTKLIARCPGSSAAELIARLEREIGSEGHITTSGLDWVDIGGAHVSKAFALESVCRRLDIQVSEVVAIGDNHNDLSVLGWAGTAMAVANAIPEVLAVADRVLPANHADGVATLLEELCGPSSSAGRGTPPTVIEASASGVGPHRRGGTSPPG